MVKTFEVDDSMSIIAAIAQADLNGGEWVIIIHPGTYYEGDTTSNKEK